jgi:hypothetical protein
MSCEYAALTDDERRLMETIEADLDREMAVEPSADFAARVRARIREPEHDGGWSLPWRFAAAAVLTIATGVLFATLRDVPTDTGAPAIVAGHDVELPAANMPAIVALSRAPDAGPASIRRPEEKATFGPRIPRPGSRIHRAAEPEVLVPDDLKLAIGRVMEMVRAGTLNAQVFSTPAPARTERAPGVPADGAAAPSEQSAAPVAMDVEELQVPPINPAGGGVEKGFGLY